MVALRICKWVAMSPWFVMVEFVIKCNSESWCRWDLAMSAPSGLVNLLHDSLDLVNPKFSSYKTLWKNQAIIALVTHISWWFTSLLSPVSHFLIFMNLIIGHIVASSISFTGEFLSNFNLNLCKWEKKARILWFQKNKIQISRNFVIGSSR